ncbi:hypothetical protein KBC55_00945 [Patescibacteria group bacterium]|nr:hypothetical protein [Patescibacteria group bacterium]
MFGSWFAVLVGLLEAPAFAADGSLVSAPPSVDRMRSDLETHAGLIEALNKRVETLALQVPNLQQGPRTVPSATRIAELTEFRSRLKYLEENGASDEELAALATRVDAFTANIGALEGRIGVVERGLSTNATIDAEQSIAIAKLQVEVENLHRADVYLTAEIVDVDVRQRSSGAGDMDRLPVSMELLFISGQEMGGGKYYEYLSEDVVWQRYPNTATLLGGGFGLHFTPKKQKREQLFGFGIEARGMYAPAGGASFEALLLPTAFVDPRRRASVGMLLGYQLRAIDRAQNAPSFARERQIEAYTDHGLVVGAAIGITVIGYGTSSGQTPGELVLRPEIKVGIAKTASYGSVGMAVLWRIGIPKDE